MSQRFHATLRPRASLIEPFLEPDWISRGALIGVLGEAGDERVVALASFDRLRDAAAAEVAFAVADEMQGIGVGTRLLEQLAGTRRRRRGSSVSCSRSCTATTRCSEW